MRIGGADSGVNARMQATMQSSAQANMQSNAQANMQSGAQANIQSNAQANVQSNMSATGRERSHQATERAHKQDTVIGGVRVTIESTQAVKPVATNPVEAQKERFSLSDWLSNSFSKVKNALRSFWNEGEEVSKTTVQDIKMPAEEEIDLEEGVPNVVVAAAATNVQSTQELQNNPYFSAISDTGRQSETWWQRVKVKFTSVAGHLMKRFSFSGKNDFQTKQEQPKEDMRKRSRYKDDDLEMDCVLTDDSYLMDSYDKKGEYRKLSAKK